MCLQRIYQRRQKFTTATNVVASCIPTDDLANDDVEVDKLAHSDGACPSLHELALASMSHHQQLQVVLISPLLNL